MGILYFNQSIERKQQINCFTTVKCESVQGQQLGYRMLRQIPRPYPRNSCLFFRARMSVEEALCIIHQHRKVAPHTTTERGRAARILGWDEVREEVQVER